MKFYVGASFPRQAEAIRLDYKLGKNYEGVSRWLYRSTGYKDATEEYLRNTALMDFEDVSRCDVFISLIGDNLSKGGRHTECGIALALSKKVFLVGEPEQVFHRMPEITVCSTADILIKQYFNPWVG